MKDKKILIVDDSGSMRGVLEEMFHAAGFSNIILAGSGEEALAVYEKEHPDMILLDMIMPELNGMDVLKKIGKTAKIIVISAVGQDPMVAAAKKLGAVDYVVKPIDEEKMIETVKRHLS